VGSGDEVLKLQAEPCLLSETEQSADFHSVVQISDLAADSLALDIPAAGVASALHAAARAVARNVSAARARARAGQRVGAAEDIHARAALLARAGDLASVALTLHGRAARLATRAEQVEILDGAARTAGAGVLARAGHVAVAFADHLRPAGAIADTADVAARAAATDDVGSTGAIAAGDVAGHARGADHLLGAAAARGATVEETDAARTATTGVFTLGAAAAVVRGGDGRNRPRVPIIHGSGVRARRTGRPQRASAGAAATGRDRVLHRAIHGAARRDRWGIREADARATARAERRQRLQWADLLVGIEQIFRGVRASDEAEYNGSNWRESGEEPARLGTFTCHKSSRSPAILGAFEFHNGTRLSAYLRSDLI